MLTYIQLYEAWNTVKLYCLWAEFRSISACLTRGFSLALRHWSLVETASFYLIFFFYKLDREVNSSLERSRFRVSYKGWMSNERILLFKKPRKSHFNDFSCFGSCCKDVAVAQEMSWNPTNGTKFWLMTNFSLAFWGMLKLSSEK